jgi:8-oxo-dGTP pyrophosphatase MutT (NUDIX family)
MVPVPVRDAATVMLLRDARDGAGEPAVEVCMLRRNLASEFVAGAYVFPGGAVDPGDAGPAMEARCLGRSDAEASAAVGVPSGGLALWVAALRECFEEAGVLVAHRRGHDGAAPRLLDTSSPAAAARFAGYRDGVNAGTTTLLDVCEAEDLILAVDHVHYVARWVTPELSPRRYDTRFFVTAAPADQVAHHDDGETIATLWVRPADALQRFEAGEIEMLPPTLSCLRSLAPHRTVAAALSWAASVTDIVTMLPIVLIEDGRVLILRPGDPGYEEALADREASSAPAVQWADVEGLEVTSPSGTGRMPRTAR